MVRQRWWYSDTIAHCVRVAIEVARINIWGGDPEFTERLCQSCWGQAIVRRSFWEAAKDRETVR